jgi:hypothetical protein
MNVFFAAAVLVAQAAVAPSAILANPTVYDGKAVTVAGTVSHVQTSKSMFRTVTGFQLCDTQCVVVIDETNASRKNGDKATVSGTFQSTFKGPKRTFKNVVVVK